MSIQVIIDQAEIEKAIRNHIAGKISFAEGQNVAIEMKAGRGDNGFSATVTIGDEDEVQTGAGTPETSKGPTVSPVFKRGAKAQQTASAQEAGQTAPDAAPADTAATDTTGDVETPQAEAQDAAGDTEAKPEGDSKPKGGLFAHLGNRTGTDKAE